MVQHTFSYFPHAAHHVLLLLLLLLLAVVATGPWSACQL
jgi:hypothetical protein